MRWYRKKKPQVWKSRPGPASTFNAFNPYYAEQWAWSLSITNQRGHHASAWGTSRCSYNLVFLLASLSRPCLIWFQFLGMLYLDYQKDLFFLITQMSHIQRESPWNIPWHCHHRILLVWLCVFLEFPCISFYIVPSSIKARISLSCSPKPRIIPSYNGCSINMRWLNEHSNI